MEKINVAKREFIAQGEAEKIQMEAIAKDFEHAITVGLPEHKKAAAQPQQ